MNTSHFLKVPRPLTVDGVSGAGVGGASIRMKSAKPRCRRGRRCTGVGGGREIECVFWCGIEEAAGSLVALLREKLVRDPHFDVVGLTREHDSGLVLRLPSKAGNGPIVSAAIGIAAEVRVDVTGDPQPGLCGSIGLAIGEDRRIRNRFDQPGAKGWRRNSEDDIRIAALTGERVSGRPEVGLSDVATRGIAASRDDEDRSCTSPSFVPFGFRLKRASRTGPFWVMNHGTSFLAPFRVAIAIKGFWEGLVPPGAGCEWQDRH